MAGLIESGGAQAKKQSPWGNVFVESIWEGLYTNRAALHSSGSLYENKYLGGRPGSLIGGLNTEISVRNTLIRRPGLSAFSTAVYPTPPNITYSFQVSDGTIRVIVDTGSTPTFALTSVATSIGSSAVYTGTITGGGSNAFVGLIFLVAGFNGPNNNGTFVCTASSTTTLTLSNAIATSESTASTAISAGAVYWDEQNGSAQMLFAKGPGAGQTHFIGVGGVLYMGDGVETRKYTPLNLNTPPGSTVSVWNWGIVPPATQPTVTSIASGSAATVWKANTFFTTMGLTVDTNATPQIWQLIGVNADGTNTPNAQFGTAGNGNPPWNQATYGTTTESSGTPIVWKNLGQLQQWQGGFTYGDAGIAGTAAPVGIYDLASGSIYLNFNNSGGVSVSGHTKPAFNGVAGSSFWDNQCHWFFYAKFAQCQPWKASTSYTHWYNPGGTAGTTSEVTNSLIEPFILPPPSNNPIYLQVPTNTGTSGASYAPFPANAGIGTQQPDAQLNWLSLGQAAWQANHAYPPFTVFGSTFGCVKDTNGNMQVCTSTTGSGLSGAIQPGSTSVLTAASNASGGNTTYTGTFTPPLTAGSPVTITGFTNANNNGTFTIISCNATTLVVNNPNGVAETHAGTATYNPWGTTYGSHINDGGIIWTCVGPPVSWVAGTATTGIWNLPPSGFQPPSAAQAYGGSTIDSNTSLVETVIISGKSGTVEPTWNPIHTNTTDNGITWYAESAVSTNSLAWTKGLAYAYSFKARAFDDFYSPAPLGGGNVPPGGVPLTSPTGSATNAISTASPAFLIVGANAGAVNTVTGLGSTDPQVDTIVIWRSDDGGGSGQMFELTEIPAPPPIGGIAQPWSFQDFLPDTATNTFPGLNTLIPAPIDESNDPPTDTFLPMAYNFTRIWGSDGSFVPFSGGPDVLTGNPNEAFAPADALPFLAPVIRSVKTTQGLLTFTTSSIEIILGGPLTSSFYSVTIGPGIGLSGYNALDIFAGETFFLDTVGELRVVSPTLSVTTAGFAIADQLLLFNPKTAYVTFADLPNDSAIYVGTGSTTYNGNTGWFRMNPRQIPGSINGPEPVWSPFAAVTNGCKMVQAIEISPGVKKLLVGPATGGNSILERNTSVFTDAGSTYAANAQLGSLFLAHRGELALLRFIEADFALVTNNPTMSYLLNEISGVFSNFTTAKALFDPPSLYGRGSGPLGTPTSYNPLRFYWADQGTIARAVHLQIGISFGVTSNADEVFNLTIEGAIVKNQ